MATTFFVMTHKHFDAPDDPAYVPLHVGREKADDLGYLGDNTGDNISDLNEFFGELTGLYWIWKNYEGQENIGINHYRRFFRKEGQGLLSSEDADRILSDYDIIATNKMTGGDGKNHWEAFEKAHNINDLYAVQRALDKLYPEHHDAFMSVMDGSENYFGNLCVMPWMRYDAYCTWLFSILTEAANEIDVTGYDLYRRRVFGFLSEPLLLVFAKANHLNVWENPVIYTSEKAETLELKAAVGQLLRTGQVEDAAKLFHDFLKVRPDAALPLSDIRGELPVIEKILSDCVAEKQRGERTTLDISSDLSELIAFYKKNENKG